MKPKVSIIIPTLGRETLYPLVQELLKQKTNFEYEIVLIPQVKLNTLSNDKRIKVYFEDPGKLPGMNSGSVDSSQTQLTPTHKKWAGKLDVSEDKVAAGLKELTETGVITYKPKEEKPLNSTPAPSGTPTPPAASN